ncbi:MAG: InlB B-repeat-containing protein, partial [Lachnospiraceae bacterium]|nr:InlB B-repeat-containing protein [Lachnospiraceae bacterium]
GDLLNFNYVFASAEFNQGERYNDCFGLFVKVNNGSWKNIAQITRNNGTKVPVSIKNLRAGKSGTEMNGGTSTNLAGSHSLFTKKSVSLNGTTNGVSNVFNAQLPVTPGDKVKIKFAICDISDTAVNSWVFIEGDSLNFKGPKKTMSYTDANGNKKIIEAEEGELVAAPDAISKDGYNFLGWNTKENGSGTTYQPGQKFPLLSDMNLYPMWELIMNTTQVQLFLDGEAWTGQKVTLYKDGKYQYALTETGSGIYANAKVTAGDYDIYVNGRKSDEGFSVHPTNVSLYLKQDVKYALLNIKTILDGATSYVGEIGLYQNGSIVHEIPASEGIYEYPILESETSYNVYMDGTDTGVVIGVNDKNKTIDFHTIQVSITDDAPWKNADVVLRDSSGKLAAVLSASKTTGNTVTYTKVLVEDAEKEYAVFIDGLDTHKTVKSCENYKNTEMTYYTAKVILKGSVPEKATTVMGNGYESYTFSANAENVCIAEHVMIHVENGEELIYEVTIKNTVDNVKETVNSGKKEITLTYRLVNMFTCVGSKNPTTHAYEYNYSTKAFKKTYVRHGINVPPYEGKITLSGHAFDFWSEAEWDPEAEVENTPFDFVNTKIERDYDLYANYAIPTVAIGEVVKTNEAGTINGIGPYYRMANLTISGFDKGEDAIKHVFLTTSNTNAITILDGNVSTSGIKLINGTKEVDTSSGGNIENIIPSGDKVAITFNTAISMAKAQDFLRNQIVVTPTLGKLHTMVVEVLDGAGEYVAANGVSSSVANIKDAVELKGSTSGVTLESGNYYLTKDVTYEGNSNNRSGIKIKEGATVYIYIPAEITLTAKGYGYGTNATGTAGAGAGIHVPSTSTLVFVGKGSVVATGGNAASGTNGSNGEDGYIDYNSKDGYDNWYRSGGSGAGGAGGGGAGAGIGGTGGTGGTGGSAIGNSGPLEKDGYSGTQANGSTGNSGGTGTNGGSCGTVYILDSVSVTAKGGEQGTKGGSGGSAGSYKLCSNSFGEHTYHVAGGGGGGGGGGAGYYANGIGSGGPGGGGGASGGSGAADYSGDSYSTGNSNSLCGGAGGSGGSGYYSGASGAGTRDSGTYNSKWNQTGGYGGSGGSNGSFGSNGSTYVAKNAKLNNSFGTSTTTNYASYNIEFKTPNTTATKPQTLTYNYGSQYTFTLPQYVDSNVNVKFLGWQLSVYPKSGNAGSPLTTEADIAKRYEEGESVQLDPTTYGNIVFTAVTETIGGIRDDDDTSKKFIENSEADTYYTYKVVVTVDGEIDKNRGKIKVGDNYVTAGADGTYTLIATNKEKKNILIGGKKVGETEDFGLLLNQDQSSTTIEYETLKVEVEGKIPNTVVLDGGPNLLDEGNSEGNRKYSCERLKESSSGSWAIIVDGENCGKTASYGKTTIVDYNTVTVSITKQGNAAEAISSVELRDSNNSSIFLTKEESGKYVHTKLAANKGYTLYINGEKTDVTTDFSQDQNIEVTYSRYRTMVKTTVDGVYVDMGTVFFGNTKMIRRGVGLYELITTDGATGNIIVDGKTVKEVAQPGMNHDIQYFTLRYDMSGIAAGVEEGELPKDNQWYLSGEEASLLDNIGLTNGYMTFEGWKIGDNVYKPGEKAPITATTVAKANWIPTVI